MKLKHFFVPALDAGELLPFGIKKVKSLQKEMQEQDRARQELVRFADTLEKHFKQKLFYLGMDVIGEKSYERFLFEKGGFLEVMMESPVAINAHFCSEKDAKKFLAAFKKALLAVLPKNPMCSMFVDSLEVQNQEDSSLTVSSWNKMKQIRK